MSDGGGGAYLGLSLVGVDTKERTLSVIFSVGNQVNVNPVTFYIRQTLAGWTGGSAASVVATNTSWNYVGGYHTSQFRRYTMTYKWDGTGSANMYALLGTGIGDYPIVGIVAAWIYEPPKPKGTLVIVR